MNKKYIQQLVQASYTKNQLDSKVVDKVSSLLRRKDLKAYVRGLKLAEKARTVSLVLPSMAVYNSNRKDLEKAFAGKRVIATEDKSLLLGMKVIDNDTVYDYSLKNTLEEFTHSI